jgi:hypothetical protein
MKVLKVLKSFLICLLGWENKDKWSHGDVYSSLRWKLLSISRKFCHTTHIYSLFSKLMMKWKQRAKQETIVIERKKTERRQGFFFFFFLKPFHLVLHHLTLFFKFKKQTLFFKFKKRCVLSFIKTMLLTKKNKN